MNRAIYSAEQIKALLTNPNVAKCSSKSVSYRKEFKVRAVKEYYEQGLGPNGIFLKAGFDLNVLGRDKPKNCLKLWRKIYKTKGEEGLNIEARGKNGGRRPKDKESTDLEYLQTKITYLEAENNFLRNLKTKTKN
jgi:transposase